MLCYHALYPTLPHTTAKCHLREAIVLHEESLRLYRMARELKKRETLHHVLRLALELSSEQFALLEREDDFDEPVDPPVITGRWR